MSTPPLPTVEQLATRLWGQKNVALSTRDDLRFGSHGSKSVHLKKRTWFDHEANEGGGYADLYEKVYGERPLLDQSVAATYDYRDADGMLLYQVIRKVPKKFLQRRPDGMGGWIWHIRGVQRVPYRLPELLRAAQFATVFVTEGEKDADALHERGLIATTNPGGAGKWLASMSEHLRGRRVVILPDNDDAGERHAMDVKSKLIGIASAVVITRLSNLPPGCDVSDWFRAGGTAEELERLVGAAVVEPAPKASANGTAHADQQFGSNGTDDSAEELPKVEWRNVRLSDWAGKELPEREWIMPGWIPLEQTTGLYGEAGRNKTDFLVQLLMATSLGLPFCGHQLTRGPAFGLFCEDTEAEIVRRASRIAAHYGRSLADFPDFRFASLVGFDATEFVVFDGSDLVVRPALLRFDQAIVECGARIATLDTAADVFGGTEISRREVSQFVRLLDRVSMMRHCALLFTAHPSVRGAASGALDSGTTAWGGKVRARLTLHDPGEEDENADEAEERRRKHQPPASTDRRVLTLQKANYARQGQTIELICRDGVFTTDALDPERAQSRGPGRNAAAEARFLELRDKVEVEGGYVNDAQNGGNYAPKVFATRPDRGDVSKPEFYRAMQRLRVAGRIRLEARGSASRGTMKWVEVPEKAAQ
jgi:RecA-family ATPase